MNNSAILILAAGRSSRMGTPKQLLPIENTTILGKVLQNARNSNADQVRCVLGYEAEKIASQLQLNSTDLIMNPNWQEGLSSSIKIGISSFMNSKNPPENLLIVLGDQPNFSSQDFDKILNKGGQNPNTIIGCNYGNKIGVPVLVPTKFFENLLQLNGDKGASEFLNSTSIKVEKLNFGFSLDDIDTPEDYKLYLKTTSK